MANIPDDRDDGPGGWQPKDNGQKDDERKPRDERPPHQDHDLVPDAKAELKDMLKEGTKHPSTVPVLTGAAIGFILGVALFDGGGEGLLGALIGGGIMLYRRLRP